MSMLLIEGTELSVRGEHLTSPAILGRIAGFGVKRNESGFSMRNSASIEYIQTQTEH